MRVRCDAIINPTTLQPERSSSWLRIGGEYEVVEVNAAADRKVSLRVVDETGSPSLWPATMFTTVDERLVGRWGCQVLSEGAVVVAPVAFLRPGFWEAYFDADAASRREFGDTLARSLQTE